jgi:hypothetical protein
MVVKSQIHSSQSVSIGDQVDKSRKPRWLNVFSETRTQIRLCYVALMAAFVGLSVPVIYQELYRQINQQLKFDVLILLFASLLTWIIAGRILRPLLMPLIGGLSVRF